MISIIILTYNEADFIENTIRNLRQMNYSNPYEILVADGGSTDNTVSLAAAKSVKVVPCKKGKALQMNEAAKKAKGTVLFFIHADMQLAGNTLSEIHRQIFVEGYDGGGFSNKFDEDNSKIKRLGTIMNFRFFNKKEQSDRNIFYGDNGIFVKKSVFHKLGGFKEIPIMEDYDFSIRLRKNYKTKKVAEPKIIVSARRHQKAGFIKTRLQWILIKKLYLLGMSPHLLNAWYKDVR